MVDGVRIGALRQSLLHFRHVSSFRSAEEFAIFFGATSNARQPQLQRHMIALHDLSQRRVHCRHAP